MKKVIGIIAFVLAGCWSTMAQTDYKMDRIDVCKENYHSLFGGGKIVPEAA